MVTARIAAVFEEVEHRKLRAYLKRFGCQSRCIKSDVCASHVPNIDDLVCNGRGREQFASHEGFSML